MENVVLFFCFLFMFFFFFFPYKIRQSSVCGNILLIFFVSLKRFFLLLPVSSGVLFDA